LEGIFDERMDGNSWNRGWRDVGTEGLMGGNSWKRLVRKARKREWEGIIRRENGKDMVRREDRKDIMGGNRC
jgi:hypothetical protein